MTFYIMAGPTNVILVGTTFVFIVVAIIVTAIHTVIWIISKENPKVDRGFCLAYRKLSYRRRFIRYIGLLPFAFFLPILVLKYDYFKVSEIGVVFLTVLLLVAVINIIYNYKMWKKHEIRKER